MYQVGVKFSLFHYTSSLQITPHCTQLLYSHLDTFYCLRTNVGSLAEHFMNKYCSSLEFMECLNQLMYRRRQERLSSFIR